MMSRTRGMRIAVAFLKETWKFPSVDEFTIFWDFHGLSITILEKKRVPGILWVISKAFATAMSHRRNFMKFLLCNGLVEDVEGFFFQRKAACFEWETLWAPGPRFSRHQSLELLSEAKSRWMVAMIGGECGTPDDDPPLICLIFLFFSYKTHFTAPKILKFGRRLFFNMAEAALCGRLFATSSPSKLGQIWPYTIIYPRVAPPQYELD